jgi:P27 family predicted phage terminase small subunit
MTDQHPRVKAPRHLKPATRRWFESVVAEWRLEPHHIRLLQLAAEAWDRAQEAREVISKEGLTTRTRDGGSKLHPACRVEEAARIGFARLIRELDLDLDPPAEGKRAPALRSVRAS